jgi:succinate dehydrogenase / fumarate reductase cytochrome b subunit
MPILWTIRVGLLVLVVIHVITVISLSWHNSRSRPVAYAGGRRYARATPASRTMLWGGIAIFAYAVYHILHFTAGIAHASLFEHGDVYSNVVRSFQQPGIAATYLLATVALYFHLHHGAASLVQTLGVSHPRYRAALQGGGRVFAAVLAVGFAAVPLGVLLGIVR